MRLLKPEDWDRWTGERYLAIMIDMQVEHYTFDSNHSILLYLYTSHHTPVHQCPQLRYISDVILLKSSKKVVILNEISSK